MEKLKSKALNANGGEYSYKQVSEITGLSKSR
jgi:hypothetical protein